MNRAYKIRSSWIFISFVALYSIALFNLALIQVKNRRFFTNLADKQYTLTITQTPARAPIYDRNGKLLAMNIQHFSAFILPRSLESKDETLMFLQRYFPQAMHRYALMKDKHFMYVKRHLPPEEIDLIMSQAPADVHILKEPGRYYPNEATGPIIGVTDIDNKGQFGIELLFDTLLAGTPTTFSLKKDARSGYFYIEQETKVQGSQSQEVTLTIDSILQFLVHEDLNEAMQNCQAREGAAMVVDPSSGDILAMCSIPSFDPNNRHELDISAVKNRCISDVYEFGSVIKVFCAISALEDGVVSADELIDCHNSRSSFINGMRVNTWRANGIIPFEQVIEQSNNIGIAQVAHRVGPHLYDHYSRIGFGQKTGISLPGEQTGFITPPDRWSKQSIISLSYGYEISCTLAQLARAFCIIANGGCPIELTLTKKPHTQKPRPTFCLYKPETIKTMKNILANTVKRGTARFGQLKGYNLMGKTGTANLLINGRYNNNHNIYSFVGLIEKDEYQRVVVLFLKETPPGKRIYAAQVAAPLFKRIAQTILIHDKKI